MQKNWFSHEKLTRLITILYQLVLKSTCTCCTCKTKSLNYEVQVIVQVQFVQLYNAKVEMSGHICQAIVTNEGCVHSFNIRFLNIGRPAIFAVIYMYFKFKQRQAPLEN